MKQNRLLLLGTLLWVMAAQGVTAQEKTLWPMPVHPLGNRMNPAVGYDRSLIVLSPSVSASLANTSLTFHDAFNRGEGARDTVLFLDFDTIEKKLRENNPVSADASVSLLFAGLSLKNGKYATFSVSRRFNGSFSYPATLASLRYGNADLETNQPRTIDLDNYQFNGALYTEYSFGLSKRYSEKFSAGFHLKLLHGQTGGKTERFRAELSTEDDFSGSLLTSDILVKLSSPLVKKENANSDLSIDREVLKDQLNWFYFSPQNYGMATDLGFIYHFNPKVSLSGSVNDLGFIRWTRAPQQLVSKGEYHFEGFHFTGEDLTGNDLGDLFSEVTDTLRSVFYPELSSGSFTTRLVAASYVGVVYQHSPKLSFSTLVNTSFSPAGIIPGVTAALLYAPLKRVSLAGSWSWSNYSLYNIGMGIAYTGKRWQLYAATDNLNAFDILNSRAVNFSFGLNLLIWQDRTTEVEPGPE